MILRWDSGSNEGETCPITSLSTTCLTWTKPGSDLGLHGERPVTNFQNHGTDIPGMTKAFGQLFKHTVCTPQKTITSIKNTIHLMLLKILTAV